MKKTLILSAFIMFSCDAFGLTVIDTQYPTFPTSQYMNKTTDMMSQFDQAIGEMQSEQAINQVVNQYPAPTQQQAVQNAIGSIFPFSAPGMSVGKVVSQSVNFKLPTPIFLIGSDQTSIDWLKQYKDRLTALGAKGFLIQASSLDDVKNIKSIAGSLSVNILPNSNIGQSFGVTHYPVLISSHLIEQ